MRKICNVCFVEQPIENFSRQASMKDGYRNRCKKCHNDYVREVWYKKNADKQKRASAKWRSLNKAKVLAREYNCDELTIQKLLDYGKCQICDRTENLHIDHCHKTGKVRGILCRGCNQGLGHFEDDLDRMQAAMIYLQKNIAE